MVSKLMSPTVDTYVFSPLAHVTAIWLTSWRLLCRLARSLVMWCADPESSSHVLVLSPEEVLNADSTTGSSCRRAGLRLLPPRPRMPLPKPLLKAPKPLLVGCLWSPWPKSRAILRHSALMWPGLLQ